MDPGNLIYKTKNTPKVVGACSREGGDTDGYEIHIFYKRKIICGREHTVFYQICQIGIHYIPDYKEKGRKCAEEKLDYRVLARRYLQ